uniref:TTF-type domain-containing protein n=1 Tax=Ciona savignyi TaxID=51511 RepID=H2Z3V3_CIOSA
RHFYPRWYKLYPWLEYSPKADSCFCFPCMLYSINSSSPFCNVGINSWKRCDFKFERHSDTATHKNNVQSWQADLAQTQPKVDELISHQRAEKRKRDEEMMELNRAALTRIAHLILTLVRQNCPLRGHDESASSSNKGNFLEFFETLVTYDPVLSEWRTKSTQRNATYTSPRIQLEILGLLSDYRFLKFVLCERANASVISSNIVRVIKELGLDIQHLVGQAYDGAATMGGCYSGVATRIIAENPKAVYVHCFAHRFNLVILGGLQQMDCVLEFFEKLQQVYAFFNRSPLKTSIFEDEQRKANVKVRHLKQLCDTRWLARDDALRTFLDIQMPLLSTLSRLQRGVDDIGDPSSRHKAQSFYQYFGSLDTVVTALSMRHILSMTTPLHTELQRPYLDLLKASEMIVGLKDQMKHLVSAKCNVFQEIYSKSTQNLASHIRDERMRTTRGQTVQRSENDHKAIFDTMVMKLISLLDTRFSSQTCEPLSSLSALCSLFATERDIYFQCFPESESSVHSKLSWLAVFFHLDACDVICQFDLVCRLFHTKSVNVNNIKMLAKIATQMKLANSYPEITKLFLIAATLPVTSASAERSFSKLKLIKTSHRSTMGQEFLNQTTLLSCNRDIDIPFTNIIAQFTSKTRRLKF